MELQEISLHMENVLQVEVVKSRLLAQAEEGLLLLISCLPNTNGAINRGSYHTAVLWMVTHTCDLQNETRMQYFINI
jgi:hypothetical protein